jgi:hypothetical protein
MTTSFQNFNLDLDNIASVLSLIQGGTDLPSDIARSLGMGHRKVRDMVEWCNHLGLLVERPRSSPQCLTDLGQRLAACDGWANRLPVLDILYASLATKHKIVGGIVNELAYSASLRPSAQFSAQEYRDFLISLAQDANAKVSVLLDRASKFLNAVAQHEGSNQGNLGLGRLKMLSLAKDRSYVKVQPRMPAWQSTAYVLYDSWPQNASRMRISEVVSGRNRFGRIFFLTEPQVMVLLSKLERERAIALEMVADLRQIGPNPSMKAEDFLEMLIHEEG